MNEHEKAEKRKEDTASYSPIDDTTLTASNFGSSDVTGILDERIHNLREAIEEIDAALAEDAERQETAALLQSVPSVGPGVARTLLVDLPELGSLSRALGASVPSGGSVTSHRAHHPLPGNTCPHI